LSVAAADADEAPEATPVLQYRSPSPSATAKERSVVDILFGLVVLAGGGLCGALAVLVAVFAVDSWLRDAKEARLVPILIGCGVFGVVAYFAIGLGIGMVRGEPTSRRTMPPNE
jgi:hypothetical protein